MRGEKNGLKSRILEKNSKALYVHCNGHALNLAVQDGIKSLPFMRDALDTTYEITKLIKRSPKRESLLNTIKNNVKSSSGGIRTLCPTR